MAVIDFFQPSPTIICPECSHEINSWQGKPVNSANHVWKQNGGDVGLPDEVIISGTCVNCSYSFRKHGVSVVAISKNGQWHETQIEPYFETAINSEGWVTCGNCQNMWQESSIKTHCVCPSCNTINQIAK